MRKKLKIICMIQIKFVPLQIILNFYCAKLIKKIHTYKYFCEKSS